MMTKEDFEKSISAHAQFWCEKSREDVCMLLDEDVANMVDLNNEIHHVCCDMFMYSLNTVAGILETTPALLRCSCFLSSMI